MSLFPHRQLSQSTFRDTPQQANTRGPIKARPSARLTFSLRLLALPQSIWSRQFGETGLFSAPNLTDLHRKPRMSTQEESANRTEAELRLPTYLLQPLTRGPPRPRSRPLFSCPVLTRCRPPPPPPHPQCRSPRAPQPVAQSQHRRQQRRRTRRPPRGSRGRPCTPRPPRPPPLPPLPPLRPFPPPPSSPPPVPGKPWGASWAAPRACRRNPG
mmetsp:Transcript_38556/g.91038  ORF Transcript_38556/g.91038 Transcript_38556/m.91038 type:complete len:213 (-) Transcript_38556:271-909(-)